MNATSQHNYPIHRKTPRALARPNLSNALCCISVPAPTADSDSSLLNVRQPVQSNLRLNSSCRRFQSGRTLTSSSDASLSSPLPSFSSSPCCPPGIKWRRRKSAVANRPALHFDYYRLAKKTATLFRLQRFASLCARVCASRLICRRALQWQSFSIETSCTCEFCKAQKPA